ncbi:DNA-binding MarR family transcriptional regulator [Asanoa ferruginea]|uniref:DNA-binding MarR family transcriptional regulator n=1 Tax=Asanoa ferruginea TaxID=53367 RepID=A0A3D9ZK48_9ACTN|nr:DNA-binding MarR family transcriptional regulator [Asanoa ferruginea]
MRAARELRVVVGRLRRRLRALPGSGALTPSQTSLLTRLGKEGPASASVLAAAEGVRPQSVATLLAALDERGLIDRRPDPVDGRRQVISLSAAGRQMFESDSRAREEWLARSFEDRFTEAERQTVVAALALLDRLAE